MSKNILHAKANQQSGFTLVELMVTITIMSILAAVVFPSYSNHLVKGRRASAETFLMTVAQAQHQYLLDARSYASDLGTIGMTVPSDVASYYRISVSSVSNTPPSFTVTAEPIANSPQAADGSLSIDSTGSRSSSNNVW